MARRGFGGTALRAALGAVTGVAEGLQQRDVVAAEKKRMADVVARQNMLDALTLEDRGFTEAGVRQERTKAATPAISAMLNTAMSMGRGAAPAGVLPDMSVLDKTAGMYGTSPAQTFTVGGKTYEKMQTKQEQTAMEQAQAEGVQDKQLQRAERVKVAEALRVATAKSEERKAQIAQYELLGYGKKEATMMTDNPSAFVTMRGQDMSAATARGQLKVAQDRVAIAKAKTQEAVAEVQNFYDNERQIIAEFMPTKIVGKDGKVQYKAPTVAPNSMSLMATKSDWTNWAASEDAQRYASSVKRISDSFAVAKEGRGASNADKESYLNAVMVRPGEFKNYKLMDDKWKRLQSYINFLESKEKKGVSNRTTAGTAGGSALEELENMGM